MSEKTICHLCGLEIPSDVPQHHPLSLTRDHLIPKVRGGTYAKNNLKPAHKVCNNSRGTCELHDDMTAPEWLRSMLRKVVLKALDGATRAGILGHMRYAKRKARK